jgi:hypothetical protein
VPQLINPVLALLDGQIVTCGEYYDSQVDFDVTFSSFESISRIFTVARVARWYIYIFSNQKYQFGYSLEVLGMESVGIFHVH